MPDKEGGIQSITNAGTKSRMDTNPVLPNDQNQAFSGFGVYEKTPPRKPRQNAPKTPRDRLYLSSFRVW